MLPADTVDDLRMKLANYKRSREGAARSMHRWLDALIADAEEKMRSLGAPVPVADDAGTDGDGPAPTATSGVTSVDAFRSTYPFDENAPRQRIL
jgi:hypothetical protein